MEETLQKELEDNGPDDIQGGILRRLRDRDLLRKRKAEAEEKETYQWVNGEERRKKRPRGEGRSTGKRGRPRKTPEVVVAQEEPALAVDAPEEVPEPPQAIAVQTALPFVGRGILESQSTYASAAPAAPFPVLSSVQSPALTSVSTPAPNAPPAAVPDTVSNTAPDTNAAPAIPRDATPPTPVALSQASVYLPPLAPTPSIAPLQVETLDTESHGGDAVTQVIIEDLGPDEEEDIAISQNTGADQDMNKEPTCLNNMPEQNTVFSSPMLSTQPSSQEYLTGN